MATEVKTVKYAVGDERPPIELTVKLDDTTVKNLTGLVSAVFYLYPVVEGVVGTVKVDAAAVVLSDLVNGKITWTPATGSPSADTDTAGRFLGIFVGYWGAATTLPQWLGTVEVKIYTLTEIGIA